MTAVGEKLYIIGGRANENMLFNDVHIYDPGLFHGHVNATGGISDTLTALRPFNALICLFVLLMCSLLATNTWSTPSVRGNTPDARDFHTIALAGDDKVGVGSSGIPLSCCSCREAHPTV
jgi:hypothetical protein